MFLPFLALLAGTAIPAEIRLANEAALASGPVAPGEIIRLLAVGPPVTLEDWSVRFDGVPAALLYAGPNCIDVVVPETLAGKLATHVEITAAHQLVAEWAAPVIGAIDVEPSVTPSPPSTAVQPDPDHRPPRRHWVSLTWVASVSPNVTGYTVYRATKPGGPYTPVTKALVTGTTFLDRAVAAGQTYYYVVTASDAGNNQSGYSNEAKAVLPHR